MVNVIVTNPIQANLVFQVPISWGVDEIIAAHKKDGLYI